MSAKKLVVMSCTLILTAILCLTGTAAAANQIDLRSLGEKFTQVAHPTGENVTYLRHTTDTTKSGYTKYVIHVKYYGAFTHNRYDARVTITIDTSGSHPRIVDIDYSDDNAIAPNWGNISRLKDWVNRQWSGDDGDDD